MDEIHSMDTHIVNREIVQIVVQQVFIEIALPIHTKYVTNLNFSVILFYTPVPPESIVKNNCTVGCRENCVTTFCPLFECSARITIPKPTRFNCDGAKF